MILGQSWTYRYFMGIPRSGSRIAASGWYLLKELAPILKGSIRP